MPGDHNCFYRALAEGNNKIRGQRELLDHSKIRNKMIKHIKETYGNKSEGDIFDQEHYQHIEVISEEEYQYHQQQSQQPTLTPNKKQNTSSTAITTSFRGINNSKMLSNISSQPQHEPRHLKRHHETESETLTKKKQKKRERNVTYKVP